MSKYDDLVGKLKEIFQIDRPELDFGVYRILNARSAEVNDYLENGLKHKVAQSLAESGAGNLEALQKELTEKIAQYKADGMDPESVPKVKDLKQKIADLSSGSAEHENAVFTHLLTFFSRYYDKGDFISQRRFKGDTYAIPYGGEEVILHWANKEQYYTKSGENFTNYAFKLTDGRAVVFRLVEADTSKDNRKDVDVERRFCLAEERVFFKADETGEEIEEAINPIQECLEGGVQKLIISFEYKPYPKGKKQEELVDEAVRKIFSIPEVLTNWSELSNREPTEKNPKRTLLEKCIAIYTTKNTSDYFIHKDLNNFLSRELDFYIKNEILNLEDIQNSRSHKDFDKTLEVIRAVREISLDLIRFLSQLENFQKKLWLKKKFIVSANYCLTLDKVPSELYQHILKNEAQWEQWRELGLLNDSGEGLFEGGVEKTDEFLEKNQYLMIDTENFDVKFKDLLLSKIDNLDDSIDGLLINGDNFQGLNLLSKMYKERIDCIYIDPPYNAKSSEILYKNTFKHSSFLSFLHNRVEASQPLLTQEGLINLAIDDYEHKGTMMLLDQVFGANNFVANVVVQHNPRGRNDDRFYGTSHEYMVVYANDKECASLGTFDLSDEDKSIYKSNDGLSNFHEVSFMRTGNNSDRHTRPNLFYPIYVNTSTKQFSLDPIDGYQEVLPINSSGEEKTWRWERKTFLSKCETEISFKVSNGDIKLYKKRRLEGAGKKPKTIWFDSKYDASSNGIMYLRNILGKDNEFSYPKSINTVFDTLQISTKDDSIILDFFAGSGTTGEAVLKLNRHDGGARKYILIEQGAYFDSVIKPRLQKVIFSPTWKSGKPTSRDEGVSHCLKVIKIEGYEDALNNIELKRSDSQQMLLDQMPNAAKESYLLDYLLDIESKGSLLSVNSFKKPFDFKMKISSSSSGAHTNKNIDLVETFNYLLGIKVTHIDANKAEGFVLVSGLLDSGEKVLIIWRDEDLVGYEKLNSLCQKMAINPADSEFDVVYINGDHNIPTVLTSTEAEGGITKTLKIRQIESEFMSRMFNVGA